MTLVSNSRMSMIWRLVLPAPTGMTMCPELLGAIVKPEAAGKKAVAGHVLEHVAFPHAAHVHAAGDEARPFANVLHGMKNDGRLARAAGGGVHAHYFIARHGKKAVGVLVAQVIFGDKGDAPQIVKAFDAAPARCALF